MPSSFKPIANKVCDKSIGFHYANGKLHDTNGVIDKRGTNWRVVREPTAKGVLGKLAISIDADSQKMKWLINGEVFAESVITNYLKEKTFRAYISMLHKDDTVRMSF